MKILIVGGGGREHALAWKIAQSPLVTALFIAPGNAGTQGMALAAGGVAQNLGVAAMDLEGQVAAAKAQAVDLVVVGPDDPLAAGLADRMRAAGVATFGPSAKAAQIEASKSFAKAFMARHNVPTAASLGIADLPAGRTALDAMAPPYVLKSDGLTAGKGVIITADRSAAEAELAAMLDGKFGEASKTVLVEEFMAGQEASVFALSDGQSHVLLPACQDHKRAFDGDQGPNTGGMGAYSPTPAVSADALREIDETIITPTLQGLAAEGVPFQGCLYAGLMMTPDGAKVVEFNARFGDPETQVLMPRFGGDIVPYFQACATGGLANLSAPATDPRAAVTVIMATEGYPGSYEKGSRIQGVETADQLDNVTVFHAGTARNDAGELIANGGRVLNVTALGDTVHDAVARAYQGVTAIDWPGGYYRRDIAHRALNADGATLMS